MRNIKINVSYSHHCNAVLKEYAGVAQNETILLFDLDAVFKKLVFHKPSVIIPVTKLFFNRERQEQGDRLGQMEHQ